MLSSIKTMTPPFQQTKPADFVDEIDYRVARTKQEIEKAYSLVYREYLKRNYTDVIESGLRISIYNSLPQTTTFMGIYRDEALITATIVPDSYLGIPMDKIYRQELTRFRDNDKKICEISMLASNTDLFKANVSLMANSKKLFFVFLLFKLMFDYVRDVLKFDYICITINPKHKLTYDFLLFKDLGSIKTYDTANGAPAIAKYLDLTSAEEQCKDDKKAGIYKMFFSRKTDSSKFSNIFGFSLEDLRYFFVEKTNTFESAARDQLEYVKTCYPSYDFSQIIA